MNPQPVVNILRTSSVRQAAKGKVLLLKPLYFSPWTPPLGIALLKSFLEQQSYQVRCHDFNLDPDLWGMHHKYFKAVQSLDQVAMNDGYSKLWFVLNAHMLAFINGAARDRIANMLQTIIPMYGMKCDKGVVDRVIPLVEKFFNRLEKLVDEIEISDYSVVGTSTYSTSLASSLFILSKIKRQHPQIKTVMGGGVFADDLALGSDNLETLLKEYDFIDHVILGEGELLFLKLLQGDCSNQRVISISDLGGKTLPMQEVPAPDFSDFDVSGYYHLTIEGARSCPFQCSFCSETIQWGDYRKKPADVFADQVIRMADKYGNNSFFMGDSLMNPYIIQFSNELLRNNASVLYDGYLRADKPVADRARVKTWAKSGLYRVRLGIESASARVLERMDKMTTPQTISDVLKSLSSAGVRTTTYWIVGFPGETESDFQETCDFISEHHRYIYELEAHPHYYYPYGQVGSRLYESYCLYPEEVTDIVKFKVWELKDGDPSREEKFDRLHRISQLASDLGIPNIYSMKERYEAEERWQALHPLWKEVYDGTSLSRKESDVHQGAVGAGDKQHVNQVVEASPQLESVVCYQVEIGQKLDKQILAGSIDALVRHSEILQMRFEDGKPVPAAMGDTSAVLKTYRFDSLGTLDASEARQRVIALLAAEIHPAPPDSIRVALLEKEDQSSELLFLAHRAVCDARSTTLLLEDLCRIYAQLAEGEQPRLMPVERSYAEFVQTQAPEERSDGWPPARESFSGFSASLDESIKRRIFSAKLIEYGVQPRDLLVSALLRAIECIGSIDEFSIDLVIDHRWLDKSLSRTAGVLTCIRHLPERLATDHSLFSDERKLGVLLSESFQSSERMNGEQSTGESNGRKRLLLNLSYFLPSPWFGLDGWAGKGFIAGGIVARGDYSIELTPLSSANGIDMRFVHRGDVGREVVEEMAKGLAAELERSLNTVDSSLGARLFWRREFRGYEGLPNLEIENPQTGSARQTGLGRAAADLDWRSIAGACSGMGIAPVDLLLGVLAMLLSRLNGREDLAIVRVAEGQEERRMVPMRLCPRWDVSTGEFLSGIGAQVSQASQMSDRVLEIIEEGFAPMNGDTLPPIFDVSFAIRQGGINETCASLMISDHPSRFSGLKLSLEVNVDGQEAEMVYDRNLMDEGFVAGLVDCMNSVLREVARDARLGIGDIPFEASPVSIDPCQALAGEAFDF